MSLQRFIDSAQGLWFLQCYQCLVLVRALPEYPVGVLCYGDPEALGLQVRSLHMLWKVIDGVDDGAAQVIT